MSCDPQTLINESKCLIMFSPRQLIAAWASLVCSGAPPPPTSDTRITEEGDTRITEEGDTRITE